MCKIYFTQFSLKRNCGLRFKELGRPGQIFIDYSLTEVHIVSSVKTSEEIRESLSRLIKFIKGTRKSALLSLKQNARAMG